MSTQTARDQLQEEIEGLPEGLAEAVLEFVLFMKARHAEEAFLWQQAEATRRHRQEHPEDVQTVTPGEWAALTAHLEERA